MYNVHTYFLGLLFFYSFLISLSEFLISTPQFHTGAYLARVLWML
jgi:hypothetical protein